MGFLKTLVGIALDIAQDRKWSYEDAEFTGVCMDENENEYDKIVPEGTVIKEYEIKYNVFGRGDKLNWYSFPNGETPDPAELAGCTIPIRYDEDDPFFFNAVGGVVPRDVKRPPKSFLSNFRISFM